MTKLFRITTVPLSLNILLKGQLSFLNKYYEVTAISGQGGDLDEVERRERVKVYPIEIKRQISIFNDVLSLIKLYIFFKKEKPLIVHSITPKAGLLSMIAARLANVPIRMHTFTGLIFPTRTGIMKRLLINMDRFLCWCATDVYPEGNGVRKTLVAYNITRKPLRVIANGNVNGVDLDYFDPAKFSPDDRTALRRQLSLEDADFVFIFIGRLVTDKGVNELITAFSNLPRNNFKLILVGPVEKDRDPLLSVTMDEIANNSKIISVGFQEDIRPFLLISDIFVFPSYREGFPNVLLQAGAMGLPAIVTDINGSNEIIINNVNGVIVQPKDHVALQEKMELLYRESRFRNELVKNCRKLIADRFQQHIVLAALLNEYQTLERNVQKND